MLHTHETNRFYVLVALIAVFFALFTNVFPPIGYSLTQLLIDYSHGFSRRGLFGAMFTFVVGDTVSLSQAYIASLCITLSGAAAILMYLWAAFKSSIQGIWLFLLCVCSFAFGSFLGHTGYLDGVIILCFVLALVALRYGWSGYMGACALVVIAVLIHENALPYITVALSCVIWLSLDRHGFWCKAVIAAGPIIVGVITVMSLWVFAQLTADATAALITTIENRADFPLDQGALEMLGRSFNDNLQYLDAKRQVGGYLVWMTFDGGILGVMSLFVMCLALRLAQARDICSKLLIVGAILAPWSLVFVAVDVMRFGAISVIVGFLITAHVIKTDPEAQSKLGDFLTLPVFLIVLICNLQSGNQQLNISKNHFSKFPYALKIHEGWFD